MQQLKVRVKEDKINESKKIVKEELIDHPIIIKKIRESLNRYFYEFKSK